MENALGTLVRRFRVLSTMQQRPNIVRDIVLTCVVLDNMVRTHQGGVIRASASADDIAANEPVVYMSDEKLQKSFK